MGMAIAHVCPLGVAPIRCSSRPRLFVSSLSNGSNSRSNRPCLPADSGSDQYNNPVYSFANSRSNYTKNGTCQSGNYAPIRVRHPAEHIYTSPFPCFQLLLLTISLMVFGFGLGA